MKALATLAALLITTASPAYATWQAVDTIHVGGNSYGIFQLPMRGLWHYDDEEPKGRDPIPKFQARSSGNWRGYTAEFGIANNRLYLHSIEGRIDGKDVADRSIIKKRFPVRAHWFTGSIFVPVGDLDEGSHEYQYVIEFIIEKGHVISSKYHESIKIPHSWNGNDRDANVTEPSDARANWKWFEDERGEIPPE